MVELNAHYDGKTIVLDEPFNLPLPTGARLRLKVETIDEGSAAAPIPQSFQPLKIQIDPDLSHAIATNGEFDIEES